MSNQSPYKGYSFKIDFEGVWVSKDGASWFFQTLSAAYDWIEKQ